MAAASEIRVLFKPHWVNAWILLWAARPFIVLDDVEHVLQWSTQREFSVEPGRHALQTYVRYRGFSARLGSGRIEVDLGVDEMANIVARNGWVNSAPFVPRRVPTP